MQAALHMNTSYEKQRFVRNFENDDRRKFRNLECVSRRRCEFTLVKHVLLKEQVIKWTEARVYVYSDSVLCLGKTTRSTRCNKKVE